MNNLFQVASSTEFYGWQLGMLPQQGSVFFKRQGLCSEWHTIWIPVPQSILSDLFNLFLSSIQGETFWGILDDDEFVMLG